MTRPDYKKTDCTNALPVPFMYDRISELGIPYDNPEWKTYGHMDFYNELVEFGEYLETMGVLESEEAKVKFVLTAGIYVNKPGWHGKGKACDFDGFQMMDKVVYLYKQGVNKVTQGVTIVSMPPVLGCRIAAALSLYFGLVITWGYNSRHEDHIHFDMSYPVGWRKKDPGVRTTQTVLLQEILVHCYCANLETDGIFGSLTQAAWLIAMGEIMADGEPAEWVDLDALWLRTLREVAGGEFKL